MLSLSLFEITAGENELGQDQGLKNRLDKHFLNIGHSPICPTPLDTPLPRAIDEIVSLVQ